MGRTLVEIDFANYKSPRSQQVESPMQINALELEA